MTFQPVDERDVPSRRHRRRLYGWMLSALHEHGRLAKYAVMNPMDSRHVANALEQADVQDWSGVYLRTIRKHSLTKLNLSCNGIPEGNRIKLSCTAQNIDTMEPWGRATAVFDTVWLGAPLAMEPALDAVAGEIVTGVRGGGRVGEIKIVDHRTESGSTLTRSIERSLEVRVVPRLRAKLRGWSSVGTATKPDAPYRLEGGVEHHDEKLVLRVKVHLNDDVVNAVEEHITLASVPKRLLQVRTKTPGPAKPSGGVASPAREAALHEAVQAGNIDGVTELLAAGAEVNGRDGKSWTGLMHAASRGYTLVVASLLRAGADAGIRAVDGATALFMASESGHLEIVKMLLDGEADPGVMGPRGRRAVDVAAEGGHPRIVALLKTVDEERAAYVKARELDTVAGYDAFLGSYREGPRAEAARRRRAELLERRNELDNKAYARARASDTVKAYEAYLAEYADGCHAAAARQRIRGLDDAAYAKARRLDTVEAYEGYPAEFPRGVHAQEARNRMWQLREADLGLEHSDLVMIQRGLVWLGKSVGRVDGVFGEKTRRAIREWQEGKGMAVTGYLTAGAGRGADGGGDLRRRWRGRSGSGSRRDWRRRRRNVRGGNGRPRRERRRSGEQAAEDKERKRREHERLWLAGKEFRDCGECPEMVVVPRGSYMMGSPSGEGSYDERPRHRIRELEIPGRLAVGKYEVTFGEWEA